jgi:polyphosphate kinase
MDKLEEQLNEVNMEIAVEPEKTIDLDDPHLFINRELSMLEFQRRVLEEAQDEKNPLLERIKFLSILGSNLDEFFMVRVSGLIKQVEAGVLDLPPDGMTPAEQLVAIRKLTTQLMSTSREVLRYEILPGLKKAGIYVMNYGELMERQRVVADQYFDDVVFPVLTPLAFDPGHPFPHISNLSLNLAIVIKDDQGLERFARVKVADTLPRLVSLRHSSGNSRKDGTPPRNHYFVWLEQLIAANLSKLFPGMQIIETHPFRVTRDADLVIQELEAEDLLETMEQSVRQRRFGSVVRVTVNDTMPSRIRDILVENLDVDRRDIYSLDGPLGLGDIKVLYNLDRYDLKDLPFKQAIPAALRVEDLEENYFNIIRREDILFHHPYSSFIPLVKLLNTAARDPDVLAIKQTLYRVGSNSPVVKALLEARQYGKQVAVLVELKARFDEESNIKWAHMLESEGVHVTYGLLGLKTHSKIALIVRKEGNQIRRYIHMATGNYNAVTAQIYEDIGMLTSDREIGADATDLFNYLTGYSAKKDYRKLFVAPVNLRERMTALIRREMEIQKSGGEGRMILKMNSLVDPKIIKLLYEASMVGVKIDLIVRGICCLRPGLPGISENIRVISVVGRFLEHSRIYYFQNGGNERIYLGSADLMPRNIDRRVEVLFPVEDPRIIRYLRDDVLATYLITNHKTRQLNPNGSYEMLHPEPGEKPLNIQDWLINYYKH